MIRRLYIHNFRCLENFELKLEDLPSLLVIGRNGSGKTTIGLAIEIFQRIARGTNRVGDLISPQDSTRGRRDVPVSFDLEAGIDGRVYRYTLVFDFPAGFREMRVAQETITVDGDVLFARELAEVRLAPSGRASEASFRIDWHLVGLPIIQRHAADDPIAIFRAWLGRILILRPVPSAMRGDSEVEAAQPDAAVGNFGAWFTGLLASEPSAYGLIDGYLKQVMPDLEDIKNPVIGRETRSLIVQFANAIGTMSLDFEELSDGEKCFMVYALTIAARKVYGPSLCFWDEPDNFLAPAEIGQSILALRRAFLSGGQLIVTSHNPEVVRQFSDENTLICERASHLDPTVVRSVEDLRASKVLTGNFVDAILRGDVG
ncbi:AAA family ATPase [Methylobacterium sp. NEAU 140]|uniref:AAA family ATPase n=1 Tax=Methylobacterium sp. NEAU 140 TaxID=3064945 RepID=UPI0027352407|nr:ATP-binding protein [Methylobacterium sp. NEAU 140]MDP4025884.1 AAA family ATPase [Methylobacterium sp. NEAU 140]